MKANKIFFVLNRLIVLLVYAFMLMPIFFVIWLSFFKDQILYFPPSGYTFDWYKNAWDNAAFLNGFIFSVQVAFLAALIGVALGVAAALAISRKKTNFFKSINTLLLMPLLIPGIVLGVAIYIYYLNIENVLDQDLVGTYSGLVIAHVCLTIPWTVRLVTANISNLDKSLEEAARNLGATPMQAFWKITLPVLRQAK